MVAESLMTVMTTACQHVFIPTFVMNLMVSFGALDKVFTENGPRHYAEKPLAVWLRWFPQVHMPFNTLVNLAYVGLGIYWMYEIVLLETTDRMASQDAYMFYIFIMMAICYGPIQLMRLVVQTHRSAVLDQWYTLPFFAWVGVWSRYFLTNLSPDNMISIMIASICSYFFSLVHKRGFEVALMVHIVGSVSGAMLVYQKYPSEEAYVAFIKGCISCAGFVGLKLLDHKLATIHSIFTVFSGHFLSKICDILQIHYSCVFFFSIVQTVQMSNMTL